MNIIDKIMNALSLYDEEEIFEEEQEQKPAKAEPKESAVSRVKKSLFGKKSEAEAADGQEVAEQQPKQERKSILPFNKQSQTQEQQDKMTSKTINLPIADKMITVVVLEPVEFDDSQKVADYLHNNQPVVVNFASADNLVAKRMTDFLSGTIYAIDGSMKKLGRNILVCAPKNVDIDAGAEHDLGDERGDGKWQQ